MPALPAAIEARGLLGLLKNGESIQSIRALIGDDGEYRKSVRLHFDVLVARLRRHGKGLRRNVNSRAISERLKNEVTRLLRLGWSREKVRATLNVGPWIISRIAREIHACYFKRGRGRRFTPEMEERIRAAVRTGTPSADIERAFGIGCDTVLKFRHEAGNYQDLRLRRKLSASQISEAAQRLKSGQHWRAVAAAFRVSVKTLATAVPYRKRDDRIKLSPAQAAEAVELLKSGETWLSVSQKFGIARSTLQLKLGYWKRKQTT
jgi:DNA invertase Pin-like site-specific DNA recombinase